MEKIKEYCLLFEKKNKILFNFFSELKNGNSEISQKIIDNIKSKDFLNNFLNGLIGNIFEVLSTKEFMNEFSNKIKKNIYFIMLLKNKKIKNVSSDVNYIDPCPLNFSYSSKRRIEILYNEEFINTVFKVKIKIINSNKNVTLNLSHSLLGIFYLLLMIILILDLNKEKKLNSGKSIDDLFECVSKYILFLI